MQPLIKRFSDSKEFYFEEGCYIVEISNSTDDLGCSIAQARVEPGISTKLHSLSETVERYVVLEGEGVVQLGLSDSQNVQAKDVVIIPSECPQMITNTGEKDLIFLAICTPRFSSKNYQVTAQ